MIENVIFDIGGVLLGSGFERRVRNADDFSVLLAGGDFPQFWKDYDRGVATRAETASRLAAHTGWSAEKADRFMDDVLGLLKENPRMTQLVRRLKTRGYGLYVLSNMPVEYWEHIRRFEVFAPFDGACVSSLEKMLKPDPAFFRVLLDRYRLSPSQTLFVDDRADNVEAAERLGMKAYRFTDADQSIGQLGAMLLEPVR